MAQLTVWFALTAFIAGVCSSSAGGIEYLTDTTYTSSLLPLAKKGKPGRIGTYLPRSTMFIAVAVIKMKFYVVFHVSWEEINTPTF